MPTLEQTVYFDVTLDDFDDEDLIEELETRGYTVDKEPEIISIEYCWQRGDKKEALVLLERVFPELIGISKILD